MTLLDPSTNQPLPADAIQRVLFIANTLHVYNIPPLASFKGHNASSWTADPARHIFTARLRVIETSSSSPAASGATDGAETPEETPDLKVDLVLEDPANGQLFAAAPYTDPAVVEPVLDSSRFFALTVRDPSGRKAILGIGFEDRSEAFDLAVVLQEVRRVLGMEKRGRTGETLSEQEGEKGAAAAGTAEDKDYSLKEGETITVNIGKKMGRRREQGEGGDENEGQETDMSKPLQSFALPPPPPPPSSSSSAVGDVKRKRRSLKDLGFDDGQFGEFS
ncbi:hypothetical protein E4U17_004898 [Claviceps sp. LM77 group G4]|nr:hypothetical protein E4U17_004898 [Claviceps sp. LM77 group G4]KAG6068511.1 hypothetical protein E4U33_005038 [Claviceps sp. LM78 group G4]KAG6073215.1 hypothetical protein E4U16_004825 [Claviceps sp. LM84 group G4]